MVGEWGRGGMVRGSFFVRQVSFLQHCVYYFFQTAEISQKNGNETQKKNNGCITYIYLIYIYIDWVKYNLDF